MFLKIIVFFRRLVMVLRDKEGSYLFGVLGCLGFGFLFFGFVVIKRTKEVIEDDFIGNLILLLERGRGCFLGRVGSFVFFI